MCPLTLKLILLARSSHTAVSTDKLFRVTDIFLKQLFAAVQAPARGQVHHSMRLS